MKLFYSETTHSGHDAAYALLRYTYESIYKRPMPRIEKTEYNKPYFPDNRDIHFSLSHTKGMVMCAIGERNVGCDIEGIRPIRPGLDRYVCTARELEQLDFFSLWTLKESYIKLIGRQNGTLHELEFSINNGVISAPSEKVYSRVFDLGSYRGAICTRGESFMGQCQFIPEEKYAEYLQIV